MRRAIAISFLLLMITATRPLAQTAAKTLDIYYIDTEGGQATLFVSPTGPQGVAGHSPAYWIKVSAQSSGTFAVTNSRNGFSKTYRARS